MLQSRDQQPVYRKKRRDAAERKKAALKSRAQILGKWLWILFWLDMASIFAELLKNQYVFRITPIFYPAGLILTTACSIACGVILLKLSSVEYRYRTAGICALIVAAAQFLEIFSDKITDGQIIWALFIALPAPIIGMVGTYNEFHAHAAVLTGVSSTLSEKWLVLWKWCLGCTLAMVGSILTFIPFFSTVLLLIASIGVLVVGIVQLVYLYRTAKTFQEYAAK